MVIISDLKKEDKGRSMIYTDSQAGYSKNVKLLGWASTYVLVQFEGVEVPTRCWPEDLEFGEI